MGCWKDNNFVTLRHVNKTKFKEFASHKYKGFDSYVTRDSAMPMQTYQMSNIEVMLDLAPFL